MDHVMIQATADIGDLVKAATLIEETRKKLAEMGYAGVMAWLNGAPV